ncbi:MAG: hypothetical protein GC138_03925 [Gammaproteobacteria bacterium]|nr:hypothetical protein [Gammaproteobacteria bacterium]
MTKGICTARLTGLALIAITSCAHAATTTPPDFAMNVAMGSSVNALSGGVLALTTTDNSTYSTTGVQSLPGTWQYDWNLSVTTDPTISGLFSITNLTASTQHFDVSLYLPVASGFSPALQSGSVGLTLTDTNSDGQAQLDTQSWTGLIDASAAMSLFTTDPLMCFGFGGTGCSASIAPVSSGPLNYAIGIQNSMAIDLAFNLSAGDTVSVTTHYSVSPVPVPAAVWLFASALAPLAASLRRTSKSFAELTNA